MKPAKTQPTPEEQCCPKCGSANFWVESPTEGIAVRRIADATVHNQDRLTCHQCHYECAGVVFSATLAKRRKTMAPVPIGNLPPSRLVGKQKPRPNEAPEAEVYIDGEFVGTSANVEVEVERIMPGLSAEQCLQLAPPSGAVSAPDNDFHESRHYHKKATYGATGGLGTRAVGAPPDLSQDCPAYEKHLQERLHAKNTPFDYRDFITMPAALAYGSTPAPKPIFRHGKKHNHRCTKAAQKKARRRSRA